MKLNLAPAKSALIAALKWCGDEAHRRAVVTTILFLVAHFLGKVLDADTVGNAIDLVVVMAGGAWSRHVPNLPDPEPAS